MAENSDAFREGTSTGPAGGIGGLETLEGLDEPVATEPLRRVATERELNDETQLDKDFVADKKHINDAGFEEVEEQPIGESKSGSSSDPDLKKPRRPELDREQTNATTITNDSTLSRSESRDQPSQKRSWLRWLTFKSRTVPPIPKERIVSREYRANIFSVITFQWMTPIMKVGYERPLELNDIWLVNPNRRSELLAGRLEASFKRRVDRGDKRPLLGAMHETFKTEFYIGAVCQFFASIIQVVNPFVLRYLLRFAGEAYISQQLHTPGPHIGEGVGLVVAVTFLQALQTGCTNQFMYRGMMTGGQARSVFISLIFDKAMKISSRARAGGTSQKENITPDQPPKDVAPGSEGEKKWFAKVFSKSQKPSKPPPENSNVSGNGEEYSNGRIVNLMSVDTYRIDQASGMFHMIWTAPLQLIITLVLLLINLKASALAGYGLLVLASPALGKALQSLIKRRKAINKITDQRVGLTQEVLHAVRFVKFFGWETSFLKRLRNIRIQEIRSIQYLLAIRNGINAISMSMPVFASMLAFIAYAYTHPDLRPDLIFSSLALFNSLRLPLNMLPLVLGQVTDAVNSVKRIQDFMLAEEAKEDCEWDYDSKKAIDVSHGFFTWEKAPAKEQDQKSKKQIKQDEKAEKKAKRDSKRDSQRLSLAPEPEKQSPEAHDDEDDEPSIFTINDVNFSVARNELVAVIGGVGSGKSSILAALAGDMRRTSGHVTLGASRAFCPQYAWIQNATVRDNILFGREMKRRWYDEVIDACGLRPDLEMLPNGDLTEIGEKGITISGGQKQRLNIARAIYYDSDIILMDDPLSAVDAHVGRHIMDQAIAGLLRQKARVLATHQLWVLNRCDRIIWMEGGRIVADDTFPALMASNHEFQKLIASNAQEKRTEKDDDEEDEDETEEQKKTYKKKKGKKPSGALMQAEERAVSNVSWKVYYAYIKASGSIWVAPLVIGLIVLSQGANISTSLWLSWWTADKFGFSRPVYVGAFAALGFGQALLMFLFSVALSVFGTQASKVMLQQAITQVLRAPMSFFDTTPLGRITNRFSKDVDTMDNQLTDAMRFFFLTMAMIISVFILIIAYYYYFAVALAPLLVLFIFSASYYRASAREVKRHEAVLRSVVFSRFSEAVTGIATIRAYGLQSRFSHSIREAVDQMDSAYFLTFANQRWLSTRLDVIGNCMVFVVGILVVTSRFSVSPSTGGLVLSYILSIVQMIQFTIRQLAEVENNMNSTERIHYYGTQLDEEPPLSLPNPAVTDAWPQRGDIAFEKVEMRYRPGLPLVLKQFDLHINGGERIGIVGRTGAGKSSIMSTLFRLNELSGGRIVIDGVDVATVGLSDLRSRLAIIPQDPTLFKGTIRYNLDPFGKYDDVDLWNALRSADLTDSNRESTALTEVSTPHSESSNSDEKQDVDRPLPTSPTSPAPQQQHHSTASKITLDTPVSEEGLNFSLGQRQLMALARALVRNAQIIVCDEATSSVDMETDDRIQKTMATAFKGKTLLCIAHRLKTIIGYDRVVVMEDGGIKEVGPPRELWGLEGGVFRGLCERSAIKEKDFEGR